MEEKLPEVMHGYARELINVQKEQRRLTANEDKLVMG